MLTETIEPNVAGHWERHRQLGDLRRANFQRFLRDRPDGLRPGQWAALAGLPNANAIYNFLSGRTHSLSPPTLRRLADAVGVEPQDIVGEEGVGDAWMPPVAAPPKVELVMLRLESSAAIGRWRLNYHLPMADRDDVPVVVHRGDDTDDLEVVRVDDEHCDRLFPPGALLVIDKEREPEIGDAVLVVRHRRRSGVDNIEVTVRQISPKGELVWRSTDRRLIGGVQMPWPLPGRQIYNPHEPDTVDFRMRYEIRGVVQSGIIPGRP